MSEPTTESKPGVPITEAGRKLIGASEWDRIPLRMAESRLLARGIVAIEKEAAERAAEGVRTFWTGVVDTERSNRTASVRALAPYCVHLAECDVLMVNGWGDDCTCGLDALLGGSPSAIAAEIRAIGGSEP